MIKMQCIPYDDAHFLDYIKPEWSIEDDPSEGFILLIDDEIAFGCAFVYLSLSIYEVYWTINSDLLKKHQLSWKRLALYQLNRMKDCVILGRCARTKMGRASTLMALKLGFKIVLKGKYSQTIRWSN